MLPYIVQYCPIWPYMAKNMDPFNRTGPVRFVSDLTWHNTDPEGFDTLVPDPITTLSWLVKLHIAYPCFAEVVEKGPDA